MREDLQYVELEERHLWHGCITSHILKIKPHPCKPYSLYIYSQLPCSCCSYPARACASRGLCDRDWSSLYIIICLWTKKIESYFNDRLIFSNICSMTSCRIHKLALPLRAPETLSLLSKSRISIFNAHFTLFVHRMTLHISIGKHRHLVN